MSKKVFNINLADLYITPEDAERLNTEAKQLREGPMFWSSTGNIYSSSVILLGIETLVALFKKKDAL